MTAEYIIQNANEEGWTSRTCTKHLTIELETFFMNSPENAEAKITKLNSEAMFKCNYPFCVVYRFT